VKLGDGGVQLVQHDETGLVIDSVPIDRADESDELRRLHAFNVGERPKQLSERAGVRATKRDGFLFAMEGPPPTQQPRVVHELLFLSVRRRFMWQASRVAR